jgi:hypothetical protein
MSPPRPPDDQGRPQSLLSEAVEQAAGAAAMWWTDLAKLAKGQADLLASGHYGADDLAAGQVGLLRIWVKNSIRTAGVLSDNLAMLSYGSAGTHPPPRRFGVTVAVPAGVALELRASDLVGELFGFCIPSSKIRLEPVDVAARAAADAGDLAVHVTVDCHRAPNDTYAGTLSSADGSVSVPMRVAIDELGQPVS